MSVFDPVVLKEYLTRMARTVLVVDPGVLEYAFIGFEDYESRITHTGDDIFVVTDPVVYSAAKRHVKDQPHTDKTLMAYRPERPLLLIRPRF